MNKEEEIYNYAVERNVDCIGAFDTEKMIANEIFSIDFKRDLAISRYFIVLSSDRVSNPLWENCFHGSWNHKLNSPNSVQEFYSLEDFRDKFMVKQLEFEF